MQHLAKLSTTHLTIIVMLLRGIALYERLYLFASQLSTPVKIFRERRKAIQLFRQERRVNSFHWLGGSPVEYIYPEKQRYVIYVFGYKIYLWVSVDITPT